MLPYLYICKIPESQRINPSNLTQVDLTIEEDKHTDRKTDERMIGYVGLRGVFYAKTH